jgi:hypothetical protein
VRPGLTIPASFSLPGSPRHAGAKPRKWLKFKQPAGGAEPSMHSTAEQDSCSPKGGWGGIFSFRRSQEGPLRAA